MIFDRTKLLFDYNRHISLHFWLKRKSVCCSGHEVVLVKNGQRACGSGCTLGSAPLVQNKAYFEVKLQQGGVWAVGLATRDTDLNRVHGEYFCLAIIYLYLNYKCF